MLIYNAWCLFKFIYSVALAGVASSILGPVLSGIHYAHFDCPSCVCANVYSNDNYIHTKQKLHVHVTVVGP